MSLLIKGMEMPKSCLDCRFCNGQANTDYGVCAWCDVDGNAREAYTRQDCPLVPVPPHGDLIDRDPFVQFIKSHWDSSDQWFVEQLEARPTIIPAEEGKT